MRRLLLPPAATADIEQIEPFLDERAPRSTDIVLAGIREAMRQIAAAPGIGHRRGDLADEPLRFFAVWSHLVVNRLTNPVETRAGGTRCPRPPPSVPRPARRTPTPGGPEPRGLGPVPPRRSSGHRRRSRRPTARATKGGWRAYTDRVSDALGRVLGEDPRVAYALVFGSRARGTARPASDLDLSIGVTAPFDHRDLGDLIARIAAATGHTVDSSSWTRRLPGRRTACSGTGSSSWSGTGERWCAERLGPSSSTSTSRPSRTSSPGAPSRRPSVVDWTVLARGIADIRDAVERFRAVLPASASAFESDRGDLLEYCDRLARRA